MTEPTMPSPDSPASNDPESAVLLDTVTGAGTLDAIQISLDQFFAVHQQVPGPVRRDLSIAAAEIGANIIEHAGAGPPIHLQMEIALFADGVRITFIDDGSPAWLDLAAAALPDDSAESGRGLAIARTLLRELSYRRDAANHWRLVSRRFQYRQ